MLIENRYFASYQSLAYEQILSISRIRFVRLSIEIAFSYPEPLIIISIQASLVYVHSCFLMWHHESLSDLHCFILLLYLISSFLYIISSLGSWSICICSFASNWFKLFLTSLPFNAILIFSSVNTLLNSQLTFNLFLWFQYSSLENILLLRILCNLF